MNSTRAVAVIIHAVSPGSISSANAIAGRHNPAVRFRPSVASGQRADSARIGQVSFAPSPLRGVREATLGLEGEAAIQGGAGRSPAFCPCCIVGHRRPGAVSVAGEPTVLGQLHHFTELLSQARPERRCFFSGEPEPQPVRLVLAVAVLELHADMRLGVARSDRSPSHVLSAGG